jgi:hypothetical protein
MLPGTSGRLLKQLAKMMPTWLTRREALRTLGALPLCHSIQGHAFCNTFSFWVFGLLRPKQLRICATGESRLHYSSNQEASILEPGRTLPVTRESAPLRCAGPEDTPVKFDLEVLGILRRPYFGVLSVESQNSVLVPVVTMDKETAVSSIIGAELPTARTGSHALMAQAVVARSFLTAASAPRHQAAFFCDTTHCQFLRSPASPGSSVQGAATETKGIVLSSRNAVVMAYYSAACGGFTESGVRNGFLYQHVSCDTCQKLHLNRRGHGWGLCQEGSIDLARRGYPWPEILSMYFPGATLRIV